MKNFKIYKVLKEIIYNTYLIGGLIMIEETKKENEQEPKISTVTSEQIVLNKFTNWEHDEYAQKTLMKMGYDLNRIKSVIAYIEEDEKGNKKVKLKVNLKPISTSSSTNNFKDKIQSNDTVIKLKDKIKELKEKYLGKHKQ